MIQPQATIRLPETTSLQLRLLRSRLPEDRNAGIGIFPQSQEILILPAGSNPVAPQGERSCQLQLGERAHHELVALPRLLQHLQEQVSAAAPCPAAPADDNNRE
jgi:hypothetical protein